MKAAGWKRIPRPTRISEGLAGAEMNGQLGYIDPQANRAIMARYDRAGDFVGIGGRQLLKYSTRAVGGIWGYFSTAP